MRTCKVGKKKHENLWRRQPIWWRCTRRSGGMSLFIKSALVQIRCTCTSGVQRRRREGRQTSEDDPHPYAAPPSPPPPPLRPPHRVVDQSRLRIFTKHIIKHNRVFITDCQLICLICLICHTEAHASKKSSCIPPPPFLLHISTHTHAGACTPCARGF